MTAILGNLYTLPTELFAKARPCTRNEETANEPGKLAGLQASESTGAQAGTSSNVSTSHKQWNENGATCLACGIGVTAPGFRSAQEQRSHFKSDWHRFNVKRRVARLPPLTEQEFEALINQEGSDVSSISGSESEEDDDELQGTDGDDDDAWGLGVAGGSRHKGQQRQHNAPQATFMSDAGQVFCVWRCLLYQDHVRNQLGPPSQAQQLAELQRLRAQPCSLVVVLMRGGHFAAAVFKARQPQKPSSSTKGGELDVLQVVAHKTFHRYVVRAKAGGKQSSKDATGKYARSAGAALRRHNEAALDQEIAELLASWKSHIEAADLIFVQAPASNAKSVFAHGASVNGSSAAAASVLIDNSGGTSLTAAGAASAGALINPANPKLRRVPFVTQRPTFQEACRVAGLLLTVSEPSQTLLAAQQAAADAQRAAADAKEQRRQEKDRARLQKALAARAATTGSGADTDQHGASVSDLHDGSEALLSGQQDQQQQTSEQGSSPLHKAAQNGDAAAVTQLLEEGCDPGVRDSHGRTPYLAAATKEVRDAFRRYMAQAPDQWDYAAAGIPSALTDELESAQAAKKAEKRARQRAREKAQKAQDMEALAAERKAAVEQEIAQAAAEAAQLAARLSVSHKAPIAGRKVGTSGAAPGPAGRVNTPGQAQKGGSAVRKQQAAATPEDMARKREQLAAAAEARMAALQSAATQQRLYQ